MKHFDTDRRRFLGAFTLALLGTTLLSSNNSFSSIVSNSAPYEGYNPFTEQKNDLRLPFGNERTLQVSGTVYCAEQLTAKSNVKIEVWHLSPNSNKYNHRGFLYSDHEGHYRFWTDFPNRSKGQATKIFFKLSQEDKTEFTELILGSNHAYITGEHWEKNNDLGNRLFPRCKINSKDTEINFSLTI